MYFNPVDDRTDMITLIIFAWLPRSVHTLEDRIKIQANLDKLEKWSGKN